MSDLEKKRYSFSDLQKLGMLAVAVIGIWWNQERNTESIRSDFRVFVATQQGVDNLQQASIEQNTRDIANTVIKVELLNREGTLPKGLKIESE
jgi:predicted nucleotidyltransferase